MKIVKPDIRRVLDVNDYYINTSNSSNELPFYYIYRGVSLIDDIEKITNAKLRYDITVLSSGFDVEEYIKAIGHVHPISNLSKENNTFTEVYSVLYGKAVYILQEFKNETLENPNYLLTQKIEDLILIKVKAGDCIYIPSHYWHVTTNIGSDLLVMANILYSNFKSIYEPYKILKGAAAYILKDNENPIKLKKTITIFILLIIN